MLGKISNALIRKEADTYREQGLHEEALHLFARVLGSSPRIAPDLKAALEGQIRQIEVERRGAFAEERQQLSPEHISIIREGWCEEATADDLRVCADSFLAMGFHADALLEYTRLIRGGHSPHAIIGRVADCLARLHAPGELIKGVDRTVHELFQDAQSVLSFKLSLAEHLAKAGHIDHAAALGRHLADGQVGSRRYQDRLNILLKTIKGAQTARPHSGPSRRASIDSPLPASAFQRIRAAVTSLCGKLRVLTRRR